MMISQPWQSLTVTLFYFIFFYQGSFVITDRIDQLRPISLNVRSVAKYSLSFSDMSCRSRLATLNEKLTALERRIEYIEARVSILHCNSSKPVFYIMIFQNEVTIA